jgi:LPS export ABC transporter protein LptC/lipopolysaccharide transport protein LptA
MTRFKNIIFVLLLVSLFVEVLIIFPQYLDKIESDPKPAPKAANDNSAEQRIGGVHLVESQKGSRDFELFSKVAMAFEKEAKWKLEDVKVQFYNQEQIDFTVTGKTGTADTKSKDIKIAGDVIIASANGYVFESKEVDYKAKGREIVSPGSIKMRAPKDEKGDEMILTGSEMTVLVDQSKMTVKNNVKASKKLSGAKKFELTSDTAELSGRSKEVAFNGQVKINYNTSMIEAPSAVFHYSKTDKLEGIIFSGGVRVSDGDRYALSNQMSLDVNSNKFVFTGQPRVYQNNDELTGDQIVFLDGGKKVKVENIRARVENKKK